jgi:hypothetical protein
MAEENLYRPGTRRGSKIWNFIGLGALLLLMVSVFFVGGLAVRNPGLIPALLSGRLRLWPRPAPTPEKVALDPNKPESYFGLLSVDPRSLSTDQRKIEEALYNGIVALEEGNTPAYQAEAKLGTELFAPLGTAATKADLEEVRSVAQRLRAAGQKTLEDGESEKRVLSKNLRAAGLDEALANKILALVLAKAGNEVEAAARTALRIGDHAIRLIDFLEANQADWHRETDHNLVFKSPANSSRSNELLNPLKEDAERLNSAVRQTR